jgi:Tfp pilus assembly protein PilZ
LGVDIERRKHKRYQYEAVISHDILSQEATPAGKLYNFSNSGLYFESNQTFYTGEEIFVEIIDHPRSSDIGLELLFDVEIVWRKELQGSVFKQGYGAKINTPVESIEKKFAESIPPKSSPPTFPKLKKIKKIDARAYPRKGCHKSLLFNYKNTICRGLVTNISRGGAFFKTTSKFSLGHKIKFVITDSRTRKNIKLMGWIVRLTSDGFAVTFNRRSGQERRYDLDRRIGGDRRKRRKLLKPSR